MVCFSAVNFPRDVLDEIWDLIESVSEGSPTYSQSFFSIGRYYYNFFNILKMLHKAFKNLAGFLHSVDFFLVLWDH